MNKSTAQRKLSVQQAEANQKLEGLKVSSTSKKIANTYVAGKVSARQAAAKIKARYGNI